MAGKSSGRNRWAEDNFHLPPPDIPNSQNPPGQFFQKPDSFLFLENTRLNEFDFQNLFLFFRNWARFFIKFSRIKGGDVSLSSIFPKIRKLPLPKVPSTSFAKLNNLPVN